MDVNQDIRDTKSRLQRFIDRSFLVATAHVRGITPEEYAAELDAASAAKRKQALSDNAAAIGAWYRSLNDAFVAIVEGFARGWDKAGK